MKILKSILITIIVLYLTGNIPTYDVFINKTANSIHLISSDIA